MNVHKPRRHSWLWRIGVSLAMIVYTLVFSEIFIRMVDPQPLMPRYITGTAWGLRGNIPNARYWHDTPDVHIEMRINSQGMRDDRVFPIAKPPGVCRIELYGDSFFMGYELDLKDTYAAQLEKKLRAKGLSVEVLNFAVSGFGTAEMVQTYERYGRTFSPDLVLYEWHSSDFLDNIRSDLFSLDSDTLARKNESFLPSVKLQDDLMKWRLYRWASDDSHLYSLIRERAGVAAKQITDMIEGLRHPRTPNQGGNTAGGEDLGFLASPFAIKLSSAIILRAQADANQDGAAFAIVEIPFRWGNKGLRDTATLFPPALWSDVQRISSLEAFNAAGTNGQKLFYKRGEGHITPFGAMLLTDESVNAISDKLEKCRGQNPNGTGQ